MASHNLDIFYMMDIFYMKVSTPTNIKVYYTHQHEPSLDRQTWSMFVTQPFLYVCYALDTCGGKSYALLQSISIM